MIFKNRAEKGNNGTIIQDLQDRIDGARSRGAWIIYCSVSSVSQTDLAFIKKVVNAVKGRDEFELFLSLGNKSNAEDFGSTPSNVYLATWLPQLYLLRQSDLSINHGGIHTILECIHYQVPMLIYSGKRSDQNGCAARVWYHGLGLIGDRNLDTSGDIHTKIRQMLTSPNFHKKMVTFNGFAKRYAEENVLEKSIMNALAS